MKTNVYLTVDVESSMGGAWASPGLRPVPAERRIFCKIGARDYGIGWQCAELQARGFRATFFCEILSTLVLGDDDTRAYVDFLLGAGQDVQLQVHPNFHFYAEYLAATSRGQPYDTSGVTDILARLPREMQRSLLDTACGLFARFTGRRPAAFRAGRYSASTVTLSLLSESGIRFDSSFNPVYQGRGSFDGERLLANVPQRIAGLWEVPVTVAIQNLPDPRHWANRLKPIEISSISLSEIIHVLEQCPGAGVGHVVMMFHSFSAVKARDGQYRELRPDGIVRRRFTGLLDYLAAHSDRFRVSTFDELADDALASPRQPSATPELGFARPLARMVTQAANRWYWL